MQASLPKGIITYEEAVQLIQSDTRDDPKVDVQYLADRSMWIERGYTFTIPLLKKVSGKIEKNGYVFAKIDSEYQAITLEHIIKEKFRELAKREWTKDGLRTVSSTVTEDNAGGRPRLGKDEFSAKLGDSI